MTITNKAITHDAIYQALVRLVETSKPFTWAGIAAVTKQSRRSIGKAIDALQRGRWVALERRHVSFNHGIINRIVIPNIGATPWPTERDFAKRYMNPCADEWDAFIARQEQRDAERDSYRASCLAREQDVRPAIVPVRGDSLSLDKATILALSGGTMTSLNM